MGGGGTCPLAGNLYFANKIKDFKEEIGGLMLLCVKWVCWFWTIIVVKLYPPAAEPLDPPLNKMENSKFNQDSGHNLGWRIKHKVQKKIKKLLTCMQEDLKYKFSPIKYKQWWQYINVFHQE